MEFTYWYLFPIGIVISIISMTSGISGANFWIPVYLFFIGLNPRIVFWLALLTMLFGFGSGVIRNVYQGTVNWYIVKQYLITTVPAAIVGSLLASYVNEKVLILIFGLFVFIYGLYQLISSSNTQKAKVKHQKIFWEVGIIAGFLKGLIATGLGKLIVPGMWNHERIGHPSEVIGSAVVIIFIVDIVAALTRMNPVFVNELVDNRTALMSVLIFVLPSVVIGGQIGPQIIRNVDVNRLKIFISLTLIFVSILIFSRLLT
ncbi:MAG: sulfite exporter TauE/SafE family protein [Methanosarcinales archaeon]|nr:MAG: sulfite exporter TauE/SafE family protein [Methanosarcinales archaeon]